MLSAKNIFSSFFHANGTTNNSISGTSLHKHPVAFRVSASFDIEDDVIEYIAAAPVTPHSGFAGAGYPYGSAHQAFAHHASIGACKLNEDVTIDYPNAYYDWQHIDPCIYLRAKVAGNYKYFACKLPTIYPYRVMDYKSSYGAFEDKSVEPLDEKIWKSNYPCGHSNIVKIDLSI